MVDFGKYNVKTLANEGMEFHFKDIIADEDIPTKFVVYGSDSDNIRKARKEFNAVTDNDKATDTKKEEAMRRFLVACIKSWDDSKENGLAWNDEIVKSGEKGPLMELLEACPQFQGQLSEFITDRTNFLAD